MKKLKSWIKESPENQAGFMFYTGMVSGMITIMAVWFVTSTNFYNGI